MMADSRSGVEVVATGGLVLGAGATALADAETCADEDFDFRPNNAMDELPMEGVNPGFRSRKSGRDSRSSWGESPSPKNTFGGAKLVCGKT